VAPHLFHSALCLKRVYITGALVHKELLPRRLWADFSTLPQYDGAPTSGCRSYPLCTRSF